MSEYIVDGSALTSTADAIRDKTGDTGRIVWDASKGFQDAIAQISTKPAGFTAIATGTHTLSSAVRGGATFTVNHNLGVVPDLFIFWTPTNIATTYSMLLAARSSQFAWAGSNYGNLCNYHVNSTTTVTSTSVTTSYGIKTLSTTTATITTYSSSTSYYWRASTYNWLAIKF